MLHKAYIISCHLASSVTIHACIISCHLASLNAKSVHTQQCDDLFIYTSLKRWPAPCVPTSRAQQLPVSAGQRATQTQQAPPSSSLHTKLYPRTRQQEHRRWSLRWVWTHPSALAHLASTVYIENSIKIIITDIHSKSTQEQECVTAGCCKK